MMSLLLFCPPSCYYFVHPHVITLFCPPSFHNYCFSALLPLLCFVRTHDITLYCPHSFHYYILSAFMSLLYFARPHVMSLRKDTRAILNILSYVRNDNFPLNFFKFSSVVFKTLIVTRKNTIDKVVLTCTNTL